MDGASSRVLPALSRKLTALLCGFALYHPTYSTWQGRALYLEDLYVRETHRGRGLGTALLARVAAEAVAQNCARLDWRRFDLERACAARV